MSLAARLLRLSRWSRRTGLRVVIARGAASKGPSLGAGGPKGARPVDAGCWMPDEDSNLD